ncbi:MAG: MFS transporter, partial [Lacipirellulaceae bacterium]
MSTSEEASHEATEAPADTQIADKSALPSLYADRSIWGMTVTQLLGAFKDNLFKQLILLLSISTVGASALGEQPGTVLLWFGVPLLVASSVATVAPMFFMVAFAAIEQGAVSDGQATVMFVFAAPFLAFTGYAGYLSDKIGKRGIVISCKFAEIAIMALGGLAFVAYSRESTLWPLLAVLFLMGAQSAFFGPAKYGILPEMLRERDLPRANGFMLMTTFLAIIFGTVVAGKLLESSGEELWRSSIACVVIAVVGTVSSLLVRKVPAANPDLKFDTDAVTVPQDMRSLLAGDRPLLMALLVSSVFWLIAGMV